MSKLAIPGGPVLDVPEFSRVTFLPGSTVGRTVGHQAVVSYVHRRNGLIIDRGWAAGVVMDEGLREKWRNVEELQMMYASADEFVKSFGQRLAVAHNPSLARRYYRELAERRGWSHNERTNNGGIMVEKLVWNVGTPNNTAGIPSRIALSNLSSLAAAATHQSLGTNTVNVTTNEYTSAGLSRTGALTVTNTDPSSLDGQYQEVFSNTFTCSGGPQTVYGAAVVDNTTTTFNMFAENTFTSATLQTSDTLAVTYTCKG